MHRMKHLSTKRSEFSGFAAWYANSSFSRDRLVTTRDAKTLNSVIGNASPQTIHDRPSDPFVYALVNDNPIELQRIEFAQ